MYTCKNMQTYKLTYSQPGRGNYLLTSGYVTFPGCAFGPKGTGHMVWLCALGLAAYDNVLESRSKTAKLTLNELWDQKRLCPGLWWSSSQHSDSQGPLVSSLSLHIEPRMISDVKSSQYCSGDTASAFLSSLLSALFGSTAGKELAKDTRHRPTSQPKVG